MKKQALIVIDHGSTYAAANEMLDDVITILRSKRPDLIIEPAHMELAAPTIETAFKTCVEQGATEVTIHPYMLSPGRHATKDIPNLAKEIAKKYPNISYKVTAPLGIHPLLGDLILERSEL